MPSMPPPVGTPFQYYPQQQQNVQLPPGKNDLEILEKLKDMIKNNQHDVFKPIPNPAALASIYMGPRTGTTSVSQVPPHPEQIPTDLVGTPVMSHSNGAAGNVATRPRSESWDKKPSAQTPVSATSSINNGMPQLAKDKNEVVRSGNELPPDSKPEVLGARHDRPPSSHSLRPDRSMDARSTLDRPLPAEKGRGDPSGDTTSLNNGKDDARPDGKQQWSQPYGQDDRRGRPEADRPPSSLNRAPSDRSVGNDSRGPPPRDQRFFDRDRDRDRDIRDRERDRDFDRDRRTDTYRPMRDERRPDDRPRAPPEASNGNGNARRPPPPEDRHYEPRRSDPPPPPRRYDAKPSDDAMVVDKPPSAVSRPALPDDRGARLPGPDDRPMRPPSGDARDVRAAPPARVPPSPKISEARPAAGSLDARPVRPVDDRRGPPQERDAPRPAPDSVRPDDRGNRAVPPLADSRAVPPRSVPPVDEQVSKNPSLPDRVVGHSTSAREPDDRPSRPVPVPPRPTDVADARAAARRPPPDDRAPRPSISAADRDRPPPRSGVRPLDDTPRRPPPASDRTIPPPIDERRGRPGPPPGGDRYRPSPPPADRMPPPRPPRGASPPRRSPPPLPRDDVRPKLEPRSPSPRRLLPPPARDYRPLPRNVSRERPDVRPPPSRADLDRSYDDRRSDIMDVDPPPGGRAPYRRSPPPLDRPPAQRASWTREPPPPVVTDDPVRRFAPEPRREYYEDSRDWSYRDARDPDWESKSTGWERTSSAAAPPPPAREYDRDRAFYGRESPPPARPPYERDRRAYSPPPVASRAEPMRPPLASRLPDAYPEDRGGYAPRDFDRPPYREPSPPPFSRVRPRSPSPVRRLAGPVDDLRPPPYKRSRDEPYSTGSGIYSPPRRDPLVSSSEYASRAATPPPTTSASYYDRPVGYASGGPPRDREYVRERTLTDPVRYNSYDRRAPPPPRSPPPYAGRPYPPDLRDDRRYPTLGSSGRP